MLTEEFPFIGRCLVGTPSDDFKVGGGNRNAKQGAQSRHTGQSNHGQRRPDPEKIMSRMDTNDDQKISISEAKGRLKDNFTRRDKNSDGFISLDELTPSRQR